MMKYRISYEANPSQDDVQILGDGIMEYAKKKKGMEPIKFFASLGGRFSLDASGASAVDFILEINGESLLAFLTVVDFLLEIEREDSFVLEIEREKSFIRC